MSHNRIRLILLALTVVTFIPTQFSSAQVPQDGHPQKNERHLEDSIPKHVQIKINVKKDKEAGFKDLNNERWAREFELEVTNTGTKSIYFLYLFVVTDIKAAAGFRIVFPLVYGRPELGDLKTKPEPTDIPIQPNESVFLQIHPGQLDAWDYARRNENRPFPTRLEVTIQVLSFGDGTGYVGSDATPLPRVITQSCLRLETRSPGSPLSKIPAFNLSVANWPVNWGKWGYYDKNALRSSEFQLTPTGKCRT